jgi:hypothetical protein
MENKLKNKVLQLFNEHSSIAIGEVSSYLEEWISFKQSKEILEDLTKEGFLKRDIKRGRYKNVRRFKNKCKKCGNLFKTNNKLSKICYDCSRDMNATIEQELNPSLRPIKKQDEFRWGNLHEFR